MRLQLFVISIICVNLCSLFAQNEYKNWYFGRYAGITFNTPNKDPVALRKSRMSTPEGCSSISDSTGKLLFYTDGVSVWNSNHRIMKNGDRLFGDRSSTQSALIVPVPNNFKEYLIFTTSSYEGFGKPGFHYSVVDFSINAYGEITSKNIFLYTPTSEKVACALHSNKWDYWIVSHGYDNYHYYTYLVTKDGVRREPVVSTIGDKFNFGSLGQMKISPDCRYIAALHFQNTGTRIEILRFDNSTGKITDEFNYYFDFARSAYGCEFSPDSKKLYVRYKTSHSSANIAQIDFSDESDIKVQHKNTFDHDLLTSMQLGPDGIIYFLGYTKDQGLSRILNPNAETSDWVISLNSTSSTAFADEGLPNCVASYLLPGLVYFGADTLCVGDTLNIRTKYAEYYLNPTIKWTGPNGFTSTETEILILNANENHSGYYVATVFSNNRPLHIDSIYIFVSDITPPEIVADGLLEFCQGDSLRLSIEDYYSMKWSTGDKTKSIYVKEEGIYSVTVENEFGCSSFVEVEVFVNDSLNPIIVGENIVCDGDSVQLTTQEKYLKYKWSTGGTDKSISVSKKGNYSVVVENEKGCTGTSDEFLITVNPLPKPQIEGDIIICLGIKKSYSIKYEPFGKIKWTLEGGGQIIGADSRRIVEIKWTESGIWKLLVEQSNRYDCFGTHSIEVKVGQTIKPEIVMSKPKLCLGSSLTLSVKKEYDSYTWYSSNWTNTRTGKQIEIDEVGEYLVEITSEDGCIGLDTVDVEEADPIEVSIIGNDKICSGRPIRLGADNEYASYEWSTQEDTKEITITESGIYKLTVTDKNGCTGTAEFEVFEIEIDLNFTDNFPLDFGEMELGNSSQRIISIQNQSEYNLNYFARLADQSIVITQPFNTIESGKSQDIELSFIPDYPKLYSDKLIIEVTEPCDYTIEKDISGVGYINTKVWIEDSTVYPNTRDYCIPIQTQITTNYPLSLNLDYTALLETDASLMIPSTSYSLNGSNIEFMRNGNHDLSNTQNSINDICGWILFADKKITPIIINDFLWTNNEYVLIQKDNGNIIMDDICFENLLHVEEFQRTQMNISPNPTSDKIEVKITSQEKGKFTLKLISIEGLEISDQSWQQSTDKLENIVINIDLSNISSGAYIIMLQSPYGVISRQLNVVR